MRNPPTTATTAREMILSISGLHQHLEAAVDHALVIEGHRPRLHHLRDAGILHHLGVDTAAMRARLEHDPRQHHRLAPLGLDALRERHQLLRLTVFAYALPVFQRTVIPPHTAGKARDTTVGGEVPPGNRQDESIAVADVVFSPRTLPAAAGAS